MQLTFIGGGNMCSAIVAGLSAQAGYHIRVVDINAEKLAALKQNYGIEPLLSLPERFVVEDVVVLAVKPFNLKDLCHSLADRLCGALVVSIASGIRIAALSRWLKSQRIVRAMPNTPAMVGKGMTGLYATEAVEERDKTVAQTILAAVGKGLWVEAEEKMDDITCVSGSGPAYVFYFMEAMMQTACDLGFSEQAARELVLTTFAGAVELAQSSALSIGTLRENVTSKGGTTERAVLRFNQEKVRQAIVAGMMDCRLRSIELGQEFSQD